MRDTTTQCETFPPGNYPNFWKKIPIIDFQSIARKILLSFLAGYLTPKTADFDEKKLNQADMSLSHENVIQGLNLVLWSLDR